VRSPPQCLRFGFLVAVIGTNRESLGQSAQRRGEDAVSSSNSRRPIMQVDIALTELRWIIERRDGQSATSARAWRGGVDRSLWGEARHDPRLLGAVGSSAPFPTSVACRVSRASRAPLRSADRSSGHERSRVVRQSCRRSRDTRPRASTRRSRTARARACQVRRH
jgi:hypothetical protein